MPTAQDKAFIFQTSSLERAFVSSIEAIHVSLAAQDLATGLVRQPIWWHLAWREIQQRYRRSLLGPFWITLSTGIMVAAMGPLYGTLLNQPSGPYFRYLAIGLVIWTFVSGYLNDVCFAFISSAGLIKEVKIPFSTYVAKILAKHLMIFGHNLVIIVCVLLFFPPPSLASAPLAVIGLFIVVLNAFGVGLILAILCARFRDIQQIVGSLVQVLFFLTPVMWQVSMLGSNEKYADWNIAYHFIQVVRAPLLGETIAPLSWMVTCGTCVVVIPLSFYLFARFRRRISYWV